MKWLSELRLISDLAKGRFCGFRAAENPICLSKPKASFLKARAGELDPQVLNLVGMLAAKANSVSWMTFQIEYQRLIDAYHGVEGAEVAEVTTAIPLDDEDI